jgi:pimeloyl-ACP methyl ester carboxylesterase
MAAVPADADGLLRQLPALALPVLLAQGDQDKIVAPSAARRAAKLFGGAASVQLLRLDRCGHLPQEEQPAALAQALASFFSLVSRHDQLQDRV